MREHRREADSGVAGAAFVVLAATLAAVGTIPVESVALILGVHRLLSQALTPTNLIGNGVATLVVAKWERALDERRLQAASRAGERPIECTVTVILTGGNLPAMMVKGFITDGL